MSVSLTNLLMTQKISFRADSEADLQIAIKVMLKYYSANGIALNVEKCEVWSVECRVKPKVSNIFCGPQAFQSGPLTEDLKEK